MDEKQLEAIFKAAYEAAKHNPAAGVPNMAMPYQAGGIFSYPFSNPNVYSAVVQPQTFIGSLPIQVSNVMNEVTTILTGVTDATGANPDNSCGNPPTPGNLKVCRTNLIFGELFVGSDLVDVTQVGLVEQYNTQPVEIQNWANSGDQLVPDALRQPRVNFASPSALRNYQVATAVRRMLARIEIDGNSANTGNIAELGWMREFSGLSRLIKDGYEDIGGETCDAVDSLVINWDAGTGAMKNGLTLPQALSDAYFSRVVLADDVGMGGATWTVVMDKRLFRDVVYVFACDYVNTRCGNAAPQAPIQRTASEIDMRAREYMAGQYLPLNGVNVPVEFTSGAEVESDDGQLPGRIFIVPRTWNGRALTYLQAANLNNTYVQEFNGIGNTTRRFYSNNGMFAFATRSNGFCDQLLLRATLRLKVDAPFLGARFDGVQFGSYLGYRGWDPSGTSFYNGGVTDWNNALPTAL